MSHHHHHHHAHSTHSHAHGHDEVCTEERMLALKRSTYTSVAVNVVLSAGQIGAGALTQSQALIADGVHSLSDLLSDFVVLVAGHHSKKSADDDHPYGHHRFETAATLILGLMLVLVGAGMLWSAAWQLAQPASAPSVHIAALYVALATLVIKEVLFRFMMAQAIKAKSSMLAANAWHARSDAASSLVVCVGIAGNLLGWPMLDPLAAIVVGLMVCRMGAGFVRGALHELTDRSAGEAEIEAITQTIRETPGVRGVHDVRTRQMGDMIVVDAHIEVDGQITVQAGHDIAVSARQRVMQRHRVLDLLTHIDPVEPPA